MHLLNSLYDVRELEQGHEDRDRGKCHYTYHQTYVEQDARWPLSNIFECLLAEDAGKGGEKACLPLSDRR